MVIPDGSAAPDLTVWEAGAVNNVPDGGEVFISADGVNFVSVGNASAGAVPNTSPNDFDIDGTGVPFVRYVKIVNGGDPTADTGAHGLDVDAIEGLTSIGADDIEKDFATNTASGQTGNIDDIDVGTDTQQFKAFTIEITNNTGVNGGLAGLTFFDVVPGEFDLDGAPSSDNADCTVATSNPPGATANGKAKSKLEPEFISISADNLDDGESCTVTVNVKTDSKTFPKGKSPAFTPTSCELGSIVLNDGVRIIHDASGATIFEDDDSLALTCTT